MKIREIINKLTDPSGNQYTLKHKGDLINILNNKTLTEEDKIKGINRIIIDIEYPEITRIMSTPSPNNDILINLKSFLERD